MPGIETLLLVAAVLLVLSVLASKASGRLGVPALVLFLIIGMLAGSDGPGGIEFDNPWVAQLLGVIALALILFAGGLDTEWSAVRPVLAPGLALSSLAVLVSALLMGGFAALVLGFPLLEGMLLGGIVASTDAAAVFAVLRSRGASLKGRLKPLIELESGSNDPMAVFLTLGLIRLLTLPEASAAELIPSFVIQMALGAGLGLAAGRALLVLVNRARLEHEGLYPVLTVAWVLLVYGATAVLGGNGFLACYIAGLVVGNRDFVHKKSLLRFHDGLAWLMQIAMFLTLGLLVFPSRLVGVAGAGLVTAAFLMLVARPVSVFLTLLPFRSFIEGLCGLAARLPAGARRTTLLLLVSDHGQVATPLDAGLELAGHPDLLRRLHLLPTGENRLAYLYLRPGEQEAVREHFEKAWPGGFRLLDSARALQAGLFGPGVPAAATAERVGDLIALAQGVNYLWWNSKPNVLIGRHGGLSAEEMIVPLLALRPG